ncbi:MAG: cytidylate kinase-like family protein [Treponema sp.]|nr:cytidylate kinase-like family protein [Treponema sp.]
MAIITLSRQVAAHGDEVADALSKKLGYTFITRKDIEKRIIDLGFPESKLPKYDERKPGFFASLTKVRDEYLNYAQYAILEAAEKKNVIIIGRGAFCVMQNVPNNISVRLVADEKVRIQRLKEEFDWDNKKAMQRIEESDANRAGFHSSFYNVNIEDNSLYHAVLNTGLFSIEECADLIAKMVKDKVNEKQEEEGNKMIGELLKAQTIVNKLHFDYHLGIEFMHATIEDNTVILHGVSDSPAIVEQALQIIKSEMTGYEVKSAVSIVHDFKQY